MGQTIYDVLDELRFSATSEADKGSRFERLVAAYLQSDPTYADQFSNVWLWKDWPGRSGRPDTGIDIVAEDRLTGGLTAIQCKFYSPGSTVSRESIDSFLTASGKEGFTRRIIVSTTDRWNRNAEEALRGQQVPVTRIGLADLEASPVDWSRFSLETPEVIQLAERKRPRRHQITAIQDVIEGFSAHDRGKLIMACGTGKTFTALRLSEQIVGAGGAVLFLVPSISLLSQSLREWTTEAEIGLTPLAVCSDPKVSRTATEDISAVDLALPATTNPSLLRDRLRAAAAQRERMTVVFATYQSIDVVAQAQRLGGVDEFDLIICDEAHRTTGATLAGEDESAFVRVHDATYLLGARRLYMTATPRIYDDTTKAKAGEANAVLASMDDEEIYGPEFHRLGFGEAVSQGLLTDYKVLVLAVDEQAVAGTFQEQLADSNHELNLDDAARIVGCWNGLAKRGYTEHTFEGDPAPMRRAVAFCRSIKDSKHIASLFSDVVNQYIDAHGLEDDPETDPVLRCEIQHVDGTHNALERNAKLDWLKEDAGPNTARILTNARCLSEGVDVPALDAVMFLNPRKSVVDVVQSVGRVMRKAPGKKYGYIILPIGLPSGMTPEEALADNTRYAVVWEVLQALRAHDERFDAMVNKIELNKNRDSKINIIGVGGEGSDDLDAQNEQGTLPLAWPALEDWRNAIYARIVKRVGNRRYWETWAKDIAAIAERHITRINALLDSPTSGVAEEFDAFLDGLRGNLNDGITRSDAIEMLAQHLITRPVFDALFEGYSFAEHNPVAQTMQRMLDTLDEFALEEEQSSLEKFYESVRLRAKGIDNPEARQRILIELYDTFFSTAFPKTVDRLGIVYTPVEIVDFILRSAEWALRKEFDCSLSDEGVHILDGFAGTGTFLVRLLQSGLISPHDLARKYANELHANEILLLAYYVAAVNIETAYHDAMRDEHDRDEYVPFPGLVLADTFQMHEQGDEDDLHIFPANNERIARQRQLDIRVIVGNPPWSSGQDRANDEAQNQRYPHLDDTIRDTYVARSANVNKVGLYDSYIRALRWATDRLKDQGVIAFVTNGGFIDSNSADGLRRSLPQDFSSLYIINLRGNQRTAGEESRREGGKVFGAGSRAGVAILVLVKNPSGRRAQCVHYYDIGSYLTREEKLSALKDAQHAGNLEWSRITPNAFGDWINQRRDDFAEFLALTSKNDRSVFHLASHGLATNRDAWAINFSREAVLANIKRMWMTYERERRRYHESVKTDAAPTVTNDPREIAWGSLMRSDFKKNRPLSFDPACARVGLYKPFTKEWLYFHRDFNHSGYKLLDIFPRPESDNLCIIVTSAGSHDPFSVIMSDVLPNKHALDTCMVFPRWKYEKLDGTLFDQRDEGGERYRRVDNVSDEVLALFRNAYGAGIEKDDVFYYIYGLLHSNEFRGRYAADLKKMLPRVPLVKDFDAFVKAGRELAVLHINYESAEIYPLGGLYDAPQDLDEDAAYEYYGVEKMRFGKPTPTQRAAGERHDRSTILYNSRITLRGIPLDAHRYTLGSRSAVEWVIDRYQVRTDKASGIRNDPNAWSREVGNPRYIVDLVARLVTVSLETLRIVDRLPPLKLLDE
jgi:predicted helicase